MTLQLGVGGVHLVLNLVPKVQYDNPDNDGMNMNSQ
jgi:hypothetical protein